MPGPTGQTPPTPTPPGPRRRGEKDPAEGDAPFQPSRGGRPGRKEQQATWRGAVASRGPRIRRQESQEQKSSGRGTGDTSVTKEQGTSLPSGGDAGAPQSQAHLCEPRRPVAGDTEVWGCPNQRRLSGTGPDWRQEGSRGGRPHPGRHAGARGNHPQEGKRVTGKRGPWVKSVWVGFFFDFCNIL